LRWNFFELGVCGLHNSQLKTGHIFVRCPVRGLLIIDKRNEGWYMFIPAVFISETLVTLVWISLISRPQCVDVVYWPVRKRQCLFNLIYQKTATV